MSMIDNYQYVIAWVIYCLAGLGCSLVCWKVTSYMRNYSWRGLIRGTVLVLIFTPWYTQQSTLFFAPAILILFMDLLIEGAKSGLRGGLVILTSLFVMLVILTIRQYLRRRPQDV